MRAVIPDATERAALQLFGVVQPAVVQAMVDALASIGIVTTKDAVLVPGIAQEFTTLGEVMNALNAAAHRMGLEPKSGPLALQLAAAAMNYSNAWFKLEQKVRI